MASISVIRVRQDASCRHRFLCTDNDQVPIDLSAGTLSLEVRLKLTKALVDTWTIGNRLTVIGNPVNGIVELYLSPESVDVGSYLLMFRWEVGADEWEEDGPQLMVFEPS